MPIRHGPTVVFKYHHKQLAIIICWICRTHVYVVLLKDNKKPRRGGKKHPLMIKLKVALVNIKSIWKFRCKHGTDS